KLIEKYNTPVPRYTSYPPVPFWANDHHTLSWQESIIDNANVDMYVHIPYCEQLCYYCGCNRIITKNHDNEQRLIECIAKEWDLYTTLRGKKLTVANLHLGGGTPTFLSASNLDKLLARLLANRSDSFIGSIEIDPRRYNIEQIEVMNKHGITRFSLGVQDFDSDVQKHINRIQSVELVKKCVDELRSFNAESINFDLIYGLPLQTIETVTNTIESVQLLQPDSIAL